MQQQQRRSSDGLAATAPSGTWMLYYPFGWLPDVSCGKAVIRASGDDYLAIQKQKLTRSLWRRMWYEEDVADDVHTHGSDQLTQTRRTLAIYPWRR